MSAKSRRALGSVLFLLGFGMTATLGLLSGADKQPTRATSVLLVVLAGVFQAGSASQFYAIGRADPGLARAAVRRILRLATRTRNARIATENIFDGASQKEVHRLIGRLSVELSWLEEGLTEAFEDWNEFHGEALRKLAKGNDADVGSD